MGIEPRRDAESLRGARRSTGRRLPKRAAAGRRSFTSTLKALDDLAASGAKISVRITDLDRGTSVLSGDDFVTLPVAGLGVVPLDRKSTRQNSSHNALSRMPSSA